MEPQHLYKIPVTQIEDLRVISGDTGDLVDPAQQELGLAHEAPFDRMEDGAFIVFERDAPGRDDEQARGALARAEQVGLRRVEVQSQFQREVLEHAPAAARYRS